MPSCDGHAHGVHDTGSVVVGSRTRAAVRRSLNRALVTAPRKAGDTKAAYLGVRINHHQPL